MLTKKNIKEWENLLRKNNFITKAIGIYISIILLSGVFVFVPSVKSNPEDPWYNTNWIYRKEITVHHSMVLRSERAHV